MLWVLLTILGVAGIVLVLNGETEQVAGLSSTVIAQAAIGVAMLLFVGSGVLRNYQGRYAQAAKDMMTWVAMGFVLVLGYSYKDQFKSVLGRVAGELNPGGTPVAVDDRNTGERAVRLRRRRDGHFGTRIEVNGSSFPVMIDTGATSIALKLADAKAAGIDTDRLDFSTPVRTANGTAYVADVRLKRVAMGGIVLENVDAHVSKAGVLTESLLGMSFLTRLRSYEVSGDYMTLRE